MQPDQASDRSDHPAFRDGVYRRRRDALAAIARDHTQARVEYTADEHRTWATVRGRLDPLHARHGCAAVLAAQRCVPLSPVRIPQLAEVSAALARTTGFRLRAVEGLVAPRPFFAALAEGTFLATQYVRHHDSPLYTPEPDVIHELVGHVGLLAEPRIAALARACGAAAVAADDARLEAIARVFWYVLEFGLCLEHGEVRVVGAGVLSSVGEFEHAIAGESPTLRTAWDLDRMAELPYETQGFQRVLFLAPSFDVLIDGTMGWLARGPVRYHDAGGSP